MTGWRLAAPAKLNLSLAVVGRRADGYHELDTLMVLLDLADGLVLRPDAGPGFHVGGPAAAGVPTDRSNLAWTGLAAGLNDKVPAMELTLDKRIPAAAGLGGGSSDAAAAWRLGRRSSGRDDERPEQASLVELARIGADIPFFVAQLTTARVGGVGEQVSAVDHHPSANEVVLLHPPFGLTTAAVFAELRRGDWSGPLAAAAGPEPGHNDLAAPARRLRPEIDDLFRLVAGAGGEPRLTGSGPTVFALTDDPQRADGIGARLLRAGLAITRTRLRREPASIATDD